MKRTEKWLRLIRPIGQAIINPHDVIVNRDCSLESRSDTIQIDPGAKDMRLRKFNLARPRPHFAVIGHPLAGDLAGGDGGQAIVGAAHRAGLKRIARAVGEEPSAIGPPHPLASAAAVLEAQDLPAESWDDHDLDAGASQSDQFKSIERGLEDGWFA